jgi:hypothetical protein
MSEEEQKRFTPFELVLYQHTLEYNTIYHTSIYSSYLGILQYVQIYYDILISFCDILYFCVQDTILVVPPSPYCIEEVTWRFATHRVDMTSRKRNKVSP